jgi:hypothetical protein
MLLRYALVLTEAGFQFDTIQRKVLSLNDKIPDSLEESEILSTILITVAKRLGNGQG